MRQDKYMIVLLEEGNNKLLEDFHSLEEKTKYILSRTHLYVYWIKPVCSDDEEWNVVGSNIRYAFSGDIGGSIPKYLNVKGRSRTEIVFQLITIWSPFFSPMMSSFSHHQYRTSTTTTPNTESATGTNRTTPFPLVPMESNTLTTPNLIT